ncbi:resuscitation-promoting factor [Streptomyces dioscori]|uniref:Resuscitation-promoting factor n=1 Tax=Streptomyces dioscori TaxID=2109333 RepID=A0A2P8QCU2_9ACTN|nr:resuscitation-promoting factor [Streptomyces dioscori]PSM44081.1 resuscitation-promoting factor [Streptomyces dioscori]
MSSPQYETYGPNVNPDTYRPAYGQEHEPAYGYEHAYEHAYEYAYEYGNRHGPVYAYELEHEPAYGHEYGHGHVHPGEAWFPDAPTLPRQAVPLAPTAELTTELTAELADELFNGPAARSGGRAEARRAARRRRSADRPDVRKLLPQALVVAFLAGGTSAFVADDKAIELTVDGRPRTLHTFADDVGELLADEGVEVGAHDVVAPAAGTALTSGAEIAVEYGRPLRLTLDGRSSHAWTTAHTVDEALRELGVRAQGAYVSVPLTRRIGRAGLALDVRTERTVTVMADGQARTVRTNAATVGETVAEAGITLHGQDTTSVPGDSFPRDGQTVTVMRITGTKEVREESLPFEVRRTDDPGLFRGTEVVEQAGRPGLRRVTYALRTVNGVEQKPRRLRAEVVREPRAQVVKVGTKPLPTSVQGADRLNWQGLAHCESGGRPGAVDPSGTYGGLYQFDTRTWQALGGAGRPQDASAAEQTFRAKKLYVRRGASPWPHCGGRL